MGKVNENRRNDSFAALELAGICRYLDKVVRKLNRRVEYEQMKKIESQIKQL